jgi:hypothetical protein
MVVHGVVSDNLGPGQSAAVARKSMHNAIEFRAVVSGVGRVGQTIHRSGANRIRW